MEQNLADLLAAAISNSYGSYYGSVLRALATRNRATAANLIQALPKSKPNDVRLALVTLVQQHIVRYHTDKHTRITYYEPNWENAYNFTCRAPTLYKFVEERFNTQVARVFDFISRSGVARVGDLVQDLIPKPAEEDVETNGKTNGDVRPNGFAHKQAEKEKLEEIYGAVNLLLTSGYIMPVKHERQFWPDYDRKQEAVADITAAKFPGGPTGKKDRDVIEEESNRLLRRWREEDTTSAEHKRTNGRKRARSPDADDDVRMPKRHHANGQPLNGINGQIRTGLSAHQEPLDDDLVLTVNFEKCNVGLRNNQFVKFCERFISHTTAKVFDAMLRVLEPDIKQCHDPLEQRQEGEREFSGDKPQKPLDQDLGMSEPVTPRQIAQMLDPVIDLDDGLPPDPDVIDSIEHTNGINGHSTGTNGDLTTQSRLRKIEQHLNILVCDPRGFIYLRDREYTVPMHALTQRLIEYELENTITHSLGMLPARIVRILKFYGNMEVWSIATRAMVLQDQARKALVQLQQAGWVDVMELPKNARREVMRSNWVHQYDVLRAREKLLSDCYFTLSRLFMRLSVEKYKIQRTIDKSLRSDIIGHEEKYLSTEEKRILAKYAKQEELVWKQVARIDEVVALVRDFSRMEYPHRLWDLGWVDWRRLSSCEVTPGYEPGSSEDEADVEEVVEVEELGHDEF